MSERAIALCLFVAFFFAGWLPAQDDQAQPPAAATQGPKPEPVEQPDPKAIDQSIDRGITFLLQAQNPNGSWSSARNTKGLNIYAPVPGAHQAFRAAVTSLCISALIEAGGEREDVSKSIDRAEVWLLEHLPQVRRATPDAIYNNWTHAYSIQALVRLLARKPDDAARNRKIRDLIEQQITMLERYESVDGGWGYYDFRAGTKRPASSSTCFISATALVALHEAKTAGVSMPQDMVDRARASIVRQRKKDYSYLYGEYFQFEPMYEINRPGGSLGRSQACNLALRLWGDETVNEDVLHTWLDRLFARNMWLDIGRKRPRPHESWFAVAGYFYYYGHYYAALCIDQLPPDQRARHQDQLAHLLLKHQDKDGCWWDFPFYDYHRQYGTAFALMSLHRCRRTTE